MAQIGQTRRVSEGKREIPKGILRNDNHGIAVPDPKKNLCHDITDKEFIERLFDPYPKASYDIGPIHD